MILTVINIKYDMQQHLQQPQPQDQEKEDEFEDQPSSNDRRKQIIMLWKCCSVRKTGWSFCGRTG